MVIGTIPRSQRYGQWFEWSGLRIPAVPGLTLLSKTSLGLQYVQNGPLPGSSFGHGLSPDQAAMDVHCIDETMEVFYLHDETHIDLVPSL